MNLDKLTLTNDLGYLAIFALVLLLPKVLLRWRMPSGITALSIGLLIGHFDSNLQYDPLFRFLSQIGITSLFVFAGLEVNFEELKEDRSYLSKYIFKALLVIFAIAFGIQQVFDTNFQISLIFALGLFTPSAGFIINSLHSFNIGEDQEYWVKSKAISKEILSIILLFMALQSDNWKSLAYSGAFFVLLFVFLPPLFRFFFKYVSPYAPNSEVPFLVVLSLISGVIAKELGAYYLVGAFVVGLIGSRFKKYILKKDEEMLFRSLSSFFNVFLPFYFFGAGLKIKADGFNFESIKIGLVFLVIFVPLRLLLISTSIKLMLKEFAKKTYHISLSLMPTLIFGLVIAGILLEKKTVDSKLVYALIFYTLTSSLLPSILFPLQKGKEEKS